MAYEPLHPEANAHGDFVGPRSYRDILRMHLEEMEAQHVVAIVFRVLIAGAAIMLGLVLVWLLAV